jgi:NADH-quinone oxidoreductase subunit E
MAVRRLAEHQPEHFAFSAQNQAWAEATIRKFPQGRQASAVIPLLWRAQEQEGWVTKPAVEGVAEMLGMPVIRVLEVATFYTMFHLEPVGRKAHVQVCGTTPCMLRGAGDLIEICRRRIHEHPHHCSADGDFSWEEVECLGACVNAPMVQVAKDTYEDLTPEIFEGLLDAFARGSTPKPGTQQPGRQYSAPISGLTTLTELDYADDGGAQPDNRDVHRTGTSDTIAPDHASAEVAADEASPAVAETAGGEGFEAEELRRKRRVPKRRGGADPAGPGTAAQQIGRVDPTGRSDEAAARAMGDRSEAADATLPEASPAERESAVRRDRKPDKPGPRSDRDSPRGDKEG